MDPGLALGESKVDPEAGGCQVPSKELRPEREVDMGSYWLEEHVSGYLKNNSKSRTMVY